MSTLGLDESLEGFRKTVTCTVRVYYSARTQNNKSKGGRCMGRGPGVIRCKFPGVPAQWNSTGTLPAILPAMMCDNMCKVVQTREAHASLDVQGFYWGSVMEAWTSGCMTTTPIPFPQFPAPSLCQSKTSTHGTQCLNAWPKASGKHKSLPGEIGLRLRLLPRNWPRAVLTAGFSLKCAVFQQLRPAKWIFSCLDREWDLELK